MLLYVGNRYSKSAGDDFENIHSKIRKISKIVGIITEKSWKHRGKRRNCLFWVISSYLSHCFQKSSSGKASERRQNVGLVKGVYSFCWVKKHNGRINRHILTNLQQTIFENIVTKGEIAQNKQFLLLPMISTS